mgnify:CR=1 FL=1
MLGVDWRQVPTLKVAKEKGSIDIDGEMPDIRDFKTAPITDMIELPRFLQGFVRGRLLRQPICDLKLCRDCGECRKICLSKAIVGKEVHFNYSKCIRCYCCLEVCPWGAITTAQPLLGKVVRTLMGGGNVQ